jgi:hypothetical protein
MPADTILMEHSLTQERGKKRFDIISSAFSVFAQVKRRNTTYEQKLLATVCALQKFRFYIYGRITKLFTGITLFPSCTSDGLSQWVIFKNFIKESENVRLWERCKIFINLNHLFY